MFKYFILSYQNNSSVKIKVDSVTFSLEQDGKVINELGSKFDAAKCKISVDGNPLEAKEEKMYYI